MLSILLWENVLLLKCREILKVISEVLYHRLSAFNNFFAFPGMSLHCLEILRDVAVLWKGKRTL